MRRSGKFFVALSCIICTLTSYINVNTVQASAAGLQVDYHSQEEIIQMERKFNVQKELATGYISNPAKTLKYRPGQLDEATVRNGLNTLNFIRYIAGIPYNVQYKRDYEEKVQAAALVNWANNNMTHNPPKPVGMDEVLYQLGAEGARSSNLGWGYTNLYQAISKGWMEDDGANNIATVGHRRWCLNPTMKYTGFGMAGNQSAMYAFDGVFKDNGYYGIAWPAQNTPVEYFETGRIPWSLSMGKDLNRKDIRVTLKRVRDGRIWRFSDFGSDGEFFVNNGYFGQKGCIIFRPTGIEGYQAGDSFRVEVEGIGTPVAYEVNFFRLDQKLHQHIGGIATCQSRAVCSICGQEYGELGFHQYGRYTERPATCMKAGLEYERCSKCGKKKAGSEKVTSALGHSWGEWKIYKEPTYSFDGCELRKCKTCGRVEERSIPKKTKPIVTPKPTPKPHQHKGGTATCRKRAYCSNCGKQYGGLAPHQYEEFVFRKPTCVSKGRGCDACEICRYKKSGSDREIPALGHDMTEWKVEVAPTHEKEGRESRTCRTCGAEEKRKIPKVPILIEEPEQKPVLVTPHLANIVKYKDALRVDWSSVYGAQGYIVYRKTESDGWKKISTVTGSKTTYLDQQVKKGQKYTYTVKAYKTVKGKKIYSDYNKTGRSATR